MLLEGSLQSGAHWSDAQFKGHLQFFDSFKFETKSRSFTFINKDKEIALLPPSCPILQLELHDKTHLQFEFLFEVQHLFFFRLPTALWARWFPFADLKSSKKLFHLILPGQNW